MNLLVTEIFKPSKEVDEFVNYEWKKSDKENGYFYEEENHKFIAKLGDKIVGYSKFNIIGGTAYLSQIIVSKDFRGEGIGQVLLDNFHVIAKKRNCHVCFLETSEKHKEALNFYQKNGYSIFAELKNHKFHFTWYFLKREVKS